MLCKHSSKLLGAHRATGRMLTNTIDLTPDRDYYDVYQFLRRTILSTWNTNQLIRSIESLHRNLIQEIGVVGLTDVQPTSTLQAPLRQSATLVTLDEDPFDDQSSSDSGSTHSIASWDIDDDEQPLLRETRECELHETSD